MASEEAAVASTSVHKEAAMLNQFEIYKSVAASAHCLSMASF